MVPEVIDYVRQQVEECSVVIKAIVVITAIAFIVRWITRRKYKLPPGPRPLPLIGNLLDFSGVSLVDKLAEWKEKYGPVMTCYLGPKMLIVLNDFECMEEAYTKRGSDFSSRVPVYSMEMISDGFKNILAAPYTDMLKYQRKIISQALRQYLTGRHFEQRVSETVQPVIENMKQNSGAFDPHKYISLCVVNVIHGLCFGSGLEIEDPKFVRLLYLLDSFGDNAGNGFLEDFCPPLRRWPTKKFTTFLTDTLEFNDYIGERCQEHKISFDPNNIADLTDNILLAQQQALQEDSIAEKFTDDHAKNMLIDVFIAGVDTSRQTLDWLFLVLVAYPDIQKQMQDEIDKVVGDAVPGKEHRSKLVYTEAVLLETMRLYYVVPVAVPRETMRDTTVGGYEIPAKTMVLSNNISIMRDPKHWPDPLKFNPERFISHNDEGTESKLVVSRHDGWAPFQMGHRSCVGESLAKLELVYIVAGLLQKLTFSFAGEEEGRCPDFENATKGLTFTPKPYFVKVTSRKK